MRKKPYFDEKKLKEFFQWFEKLQFNIPKENVRVVDVETGGWYSTGGAYYNTNENAILLQDQGNKFSVLNSNLEVRKYHKKPKNTAWLPTIPSSQDSVVGTLPTNILTSILSLVKSSKNETVCRQWYKIIHTPGVTYKHYETVGFTDVDIVKCITEILNQGEKDEDEFRSRRNYTRDRCMTLLTINAALINGHNDLAVKLMDKELPNLVSKENGSIEDIIKHHILHNMLWRGITHFSYPEQYSWSDLHRRFSVMQNNFPSSNEHAKRIKETLSELETILKEEELHEKEMKGKETLTKEEEIKELIYQLRTQNGFQNSQPGSCNLFADSRKSKSPLNKLCAIGYDAIPLLLEHSSDTTFTRSVGYHRDFYFSHKVLTVGQCCLTAINKITGQRFNGEVSANKWFKAFSTYGEKHMLLEGVLAEDHESPQQLARLAKNYPEEVLPTILEVLKSPSKSSYTRRDLLSHLKHMAKSNDEAAKALIAEVHKGNHESIYAASLALQIGVDQNTFTEAANSLITAAQEERVVQDIWNYITMMPSEKLIQRGLELWKTYSSENRLTIVNKLLSDDNWRDDGFRFRIAKIGNIDIMWADLILEFLKDKHVYNRSGTKGNVSYSDPRLCDIAGDLLSSLLPKNFKFNLGARKDAKDAMLVPIRNYFLAQKGLPEENPVESKLELLPVPELPSKSAYLLCQEYLAVANNPEEANAFINRLQKQALPLLRAIREGTNAYNKQDQQHLSWLDGTLSFFIRGNTLEPRDAPGTAQFLSSLNQKTTNTLFSTNMVSDIIQLHNETVKAQYPGIRVTISQAPDNFGLLIDVELNEAVGRAEMRASLSGTASMNTFFGGHVQALNKDWEKRITKLISGGAEEAQKFIFTLEITG